MYPFVESIKCLNGEFKLLDFHQQRMDATRNYFYKNCGIQDLKNILETPPDLLKGVAYKCRVIYSREIEKIEFEVYSPRNIRQFYMVVCPNEFDYTFKSTERTFFENARKKLKPDEDFLYIKNGKITDSSFANLVFRKGSSWITPADTLLKGTKRAFYIREGLIREEEIRVRDIDAFDGFVTINAMLDLEDTPLFPCNKLLLSNYTLKI